MSDPSLELQAAIVSKLKAAGGVTSIVSTRIYDNVPASPTFPYLSLGDTQVLPDKADCIDGVEIFISIDGWSRNQTIPEIKQIGKAVVAALDDQSMSVSGYDTIVFEINSVNYLRDPDGLTRHAVISFRALIQAL